MQRVPGRPHPVQVEPARPDIAGGHALEDHHGVGPFAVSDRSQVTVAPLLLHLLQLSNNVVRAFFESRITGDRVHQADGGKVMTRHMTGQLLPFD